MDQDRLVPVPPARASAAVARVTAGFDRWWVAYPRKAAKGEARKAWPAALRKLDGDVDRLVAAAVRYREDPNREDEFTKHPATWLRGECWDDDPLPARTGGRAQVTGALGGLAQLARGAGADRRGLAP